MSYWQRAYSGRSSSLTLLCFFHAAPPYTTQHAHFTPGSCGSQGPQIYFLSGPVLSLIASTISGPNPRSSQHGLLSSCPAALGYSWEEPQSPTRADRGCPAPTQHMNRQQNTPAIDLDMHLCVSTCDRQGDLTLFCDPIKISDDVQELFGLEQKGT